MRNFVKIGKIWVEGYLQRCSELKHHGVKGQKWGVKNGPPYPLKKEVTHDNIITKAIETGEVDKTINREKQLRHTKENHLPGRSYINGDLAYAQELVNKLSETGEAIIDKNGNLVNKEKVEDGSDIGMYVDHQTGEETKTNKAMIVYSKTGTHIYPRRGE